MAGFGRYNPFPFRLGGGKRPIQVVHEALLNEYKDVFDTDPDQLTDTESYAEAALLSQVWVASERVGNQLIPRKMVENLPVWEEACGIRVELDETSQERRATLDAKFRANASNDLTSVEEACSALLGRNFVSLTFVDEADEIVYWPGLFPGPPGLEWASNRDIYIVTVNKNGLTQSAFNRKVSKLKTMLKDVIPGYMSVAVTTGSGFVPGVSIVGEVGP